MLRQIAVACALGLSAPALAAQLQLDPPTLSARPDRCTPRERSQCQSVSGAIDHAVDQQLSCDSCQTAPAMPADIIAPRPSDTPTHEVRPSRNERPVTPPLDTLPRP